MRRVLFTVSAFVTSILTLGVAAPAAFAMRLAPNEGGPAGASPVHAASSGGLSSWAIALVIVGSVVVLATATTIAAGYRRRHQVLRPSAA